MKKEISSETLHMLADNQLDPDEVPAVLEAVESSPELQAELCDIRRTKDLIRHAYPLRSVVASRWSESWHHAAGKVAAMLLLLVGSFLLGWHYATPQAETMGNIAAAQPQPEKSIVFIGHSDPKKFHQTLLKAEELLQQHTGPEAEIYVVASSGGIDLMREGVSPYQQRIREMLAQHDALHFVACNNTIYRYRKAGKPVNLINNVEVAPVAVEFVASRILKGWNYVSI